MENLAIGLLVQMVEWRNSSVEFWTSSLKWNLDSSISPPKSGQLTHEFVSEREGKSPMSVLKTNFCVRQFDGQLGT
jgi:hypothetical protein